MVRFPFPLPLEAPAALGEKVKEPERSQPDGMSLPLRVGGCLAPHWRRWQAIGAESWVVTVKATNERQDDGAGILHQVAQFPIDQVYFIYTRRPCPSPPTQDPERQGTGF